MFRSKIDIDRHVQEIFRKCTSLEQRSLESLKIANLYLKIKDYESAKTYAQQYLTVKSSDATGYELLGLCHEGLGNKVAAFEEFKICLSLNLNNKNILKKLASLAIDDQVPLDLVKDKYWIERIEQHLSTMPAESFKLKEKLLKMTQGNKNYSKQYEDLLIAELEANPQSLNVYLKLLKLYKSSDRIPDAYNFAISKYPAKQKWIQQYVWFKEIVDVCALYEAKMGASLSGKDKSMFYENYLVNAEKELKFALHEKGKKIVDLEKSLALLDEVLYKLRSNIQNIDKSANLNEKLLVQHYAAQLSFYALLIMLKKTKMDIQAGLLGQDALKDKLVSSAPPLLLFSLNPGLVLEFNASSHGTSGPDNIIEMKAETHYRLSQCSLFLNILRKHGFLYDNCIQNNKDWLDPVYSSLFQNTDSTNRKMSYLRSYLAQYKPVSDLPLLNADHSLRPDYGTELSHPCSLHHMVWLGICQVLGSDSMLPPAFFKSTQTTPHIQFAARNIHLTHMNICALDVDAFLYASMFCALSNLQQGSSSPPLLPADITPLDLLVTPEQASWWSTLFSQLGSEHSAPVAIRDGEVLAGVSLVRNVAQHSLHVAILVYLARCFAKRASEPALAGSKELVKALEARSQHYWECALPALERLEKNKNISGVSDSLFRYHGEPITSIEAAAMIEEAKCTLGCFLLNANKLREASTMLKPLKSAFAKYNLAKIYVKLADDEQHTASSDAFDSSLLNASSLLNNTGSSPHSYKYFLFLQKAKESLVSAQARLDADLTACSLLYYPDLSNRILDLLTEVEMKMEQADDGTEEKTLNVSNSTFSHHPRSSGHYASPLSSVKHNPALRHNTSQRLYFSPEPNNLNSTHLAPSSGTSSQYKSIESTQVELLLEKVKRLQDLCERLTDTVTDTRDSVGSMQAQLTDMNDKYSAVLESNRELSDMHGKYLSVLESIKDLVRDKTDVIKSNTENLNSLTTKVNLLMGQDDEEDLIDEDYLLSADYPEVNPSFYTGAPVEPPPAPGPGGADGFYSAAPGALKFSAGQTLPNFYQQQVLPAGFVVPPALAAAQPPLKPLTLTTQSPVSQMGMMVSNLPPVSKPTPPSTAAPDVKKPAAATAPHNVVITTSDRLPIGPPTSAPQLSVLIPPQHLLGNKSKATPGVPPSNSGIALGGPLNPPAAPPTNATAVTPMLFGQAPSTLPAAGPGLFGKAQPPWMHPPGTLPMFPLEGGTVGPVPPMLFGQQSLFRQTAPGSGPVFAPPLKPFAPVPGEEVAPAAVRPSLFGQNSSFASPSSATIFGGTSSFSSGNTPALAFGGSFINSPNSSSPAVSSTPQKSSLAATGSGTSTPLNRSASGEGSAGATGSPHNFQIQMPPETDALKKALERSPLIKQSLEETTAESDEDSPNVPEHDPMPDFKPIIPLPDEVTVTTGEENETVLFERRAKLYRYTNKEWKERGIGQLKLLKNNATGKVRFLMRREIVHKICANHFLHPDMELKPMPKTDKAYIWCAQDYADEVVSDEQLCARFKTAEDAEEFKSVFNASKLLNTDAPGSGSSNTGTPISTQSTTGTPISIQCTTSTPVSTKSTSSASISTPGTDSFKSTSSTPGPGKAGGGFSKELTAVKPGSWECGNCYVMNAGGEKCVACQSAKPKQASSTPLSTPASKTSTTATESKYQLGGLTFSSTPVLKKENDSKSVTGPKQVTTNASSGASPSPFSSFSFSSLSAAGTAGQNPFASLGAGTPGGFKFGTAAEKTSGGGSAGTETTDASAGFPTLKTLLTSSTPVAGAVDFAYLAKSSASPSPFSGSNAGFKGFAGAGTPLFGSKQGDKTDANNSTPGDNEADDSTAGGGSDDFVPTAEFEPVIALPDLVTVVTGEEGSEVLWEGRSKLLRFDTEKKEWKERGLGQMKLLRERDQPSVVRLLMRREQVLKVCCNQRVTRDLQLKSLSTSDKAWTWYNQDFSDGESKTDLFALRFKTSEEANEFRAKFESVVAELKAKPSPSKSAPAATETKDKPSLSSLFKPSAGSWECQGCFVRNSATVTKCPACNTVKPGCEDTAAADTPAPAAPRFSFGVPKNDTADSTPAVAVPQFKPAANVASTGFTFGVPAASATPDESTRATAPASFSATPAGPPASTPEKTVSQTENNAFRFCSTKFSFSGVKPVATPVSPRTHKTSGGYRTESESEADTTVEEEQDIHFQPVIALPELVELTTGEENETILYRHRSKLFRYHNGDWKERGVGDVKLLQHNDTGKLRFIMRREPIEKICLNHHVDAALHISLKDDKTWLWAAMDYSEGEWLQERFALRFKTPEIAREFKRAVDQAVGNKEEPAKPKPADSSDDEVQIIHEKVPQLTEEEQALTLKYQLPPLFYEYRTKAPCPGCVGCEDDSEPAVPSGPGDASSLLPPSNKQHLAVLKQSTPAGTPGSISFASSSSPIVLNDQATGDTSLSSLDSNKFSTPSGNIFTINSPALSTSGSVSTTTDSKLFDSSNLFSTGGQSATSGGFFGSSGQSKPFETSSSSLFGQSKPFTSSSGGLFGQSKPFESSSGGLFGTKSSEATSAGGQSKPFETTSGGLFGTKSSETAGGQSKPFETTSGGLFGTKSSEATSASGQSKPFESTSGGLFGTKSSEATSVSGQSKPFETTSGGLFGTKPFDKTSGGLFGSSAQSKPFETTSGNLFGLPKQPDSSAKFGLNVGSMFGSGGSDSTTPAFGKTLFGGSGDQKSIFGTASSAPTESSTTTAKAGFFGLKSSKLGNVAPPSPSTTALGGLFSGSAAPSPAFGAATPSGFGSAANLTPKATPTPSGDTAPTKDTAAAAPGPQKEKEAPVGSAAKPSFLDKVDAAPSFADLAGKSSFQPFSASGGNFTWEGAGSSVFGAPATSTTKVDTSTGGGDEVEEGEGEEEEGDSEGGEHDPYFEPIIPLPDIVEVKTGEEDEEKLFGERCKLFRYDKEETKQWKERGIGEIKLLHNPEKMTYRLLMRREQVHKTVANFLVWPGLELKPLATSDRAWVLTAMNLAEDYREPEQEQLAVRFKTCEEAAAFRRAVEAAAEAVAQMRANSSELDTSAASASTQDTVAEQSAGEKEEEEDEEEGEYGEEEFELVGEEEEEDEDDIDYEAMLNLSTLLETPVTLLKRPNAQDKWETIGKGTAKISTSATDVSRYEYKVQVVDAGDELSLDTALSPHTTFQRKGKAIVWSGLDESLDQPCSQEIMLKFGTDDQVETFMQYLIEGVTYAKEDYEN